MFGDFQIQEWPLSLGRLRSRVEAFLAENGLLPEPVDRYAVVTRGDGEEILAGGGLSGDVIKGVAVSEAARGENLTGPLVSHLLGWAAEAGHADVKVYTKPENEAVFGSLGFHAVGRAPGMILLENGRGLEEYCRRLAAIRTSDPCTDVGPVPTDAAAGNGISGAGVGSLKGSDAPDDRGRTGVIVMNADPMTLGHKYLIEQASARTDRLYVLLLGGERSRFSAGERLRIAETVCRAAGEKVRVLEGGDWCISPATFPSYFLKRRDEAAEQQMRLDLDLFARHLAPALGASVRFVGSEPLDPMTARYNELMREILPQHGLDVVVIPRLEMAGRPVSASEVRRCLDAMDMAGAMRLCPPQVRAFLPGDAAAEALRRELEVPGKPGMVCPGCSGAHADMDEALMRRSIAALRPWFVRLGTLGTAGPDGTEAPEPTDIGPDGKKNLQPTEVFPDGTKDPAPGCRARIDSLAGQVRDLGLQAEEAMLRATGGVNTHRGALFALGLTVAAAGTCLREDGGISADALQERIRQLAGGLERLNASGGNPPAPVQDDVSGDKALRARPGENGTPGKADGNGTPGESDGMRSETAHGAAIVRRYGVRGAFRMALDGYRDLFEDWLPYYRSVKDEEYGPQKTLLRIMSSLDDTCVIHRAGIGRAQEVKAEAAALLAGFSPEKLTEMNSRYVSERVSPGGSADMLALTMLADALINT